MKSIRRSGWSGLIGLAALALAALGNGCATAHTPPLGGLTQPQPQLVPYGIAAMQVAADIEIKLPVSGKTLTVKAGYLFNGCSVPQELWDTGLYPYRPDLCRAALVHDLLFEAQLPGWTEAAANAEFFVLLAEDGVPGDDLDAIRFGVELAGWVDWQAHVSDPIGIAYARKFVSVK